MTAAELYEIVKDVPREAWPELEYENWRWVDGHTEAYTRVALVEQAFIGSMTAWLLKACNRVETQSTPWGSVECTTFGEESRKEGSSLVAALAAACKEAETDAAGELEDKP